MNLKQKFLQKRISLFTHLGFGGFYWGLAIFVDRVNNDPLYYHSYNPDTSLIILFAVLCACLGVLGIMLRIDPEVQQL